MLLGLKEHLGVLEKDKISVFQKFNLVRSNPELRIDCKIHPLLEGKLDEFDGCYGESTLRRNIK